MRDTIDMAREAEIGDSHGYIIAHELAHLKAFEALVRADERERLAKIQFESILQAMKIEREACAKVCEDYTDNDGGTFIDHEGHGYSCAAAIRERSANERARGVASKKGETK